MKNLLVISNGHGEDIIGANILKELITVYKRENWDNLEDMPGIKVLPIVGEGQAYKSLQVRLIGPGKVLPSGGFARNSISNFLKDIKAGLLGLTISQVRHLKNIRNEVKLVLVVGDIYALLLAGLFVRKKIIFLPTAKSEYITGHYWIEEIIMKKMANLVLPRDQKTADVLRNKGVNARFVGNAMMDCFTVKDQDFGVPQGCRIIGVLPGSREEAYNNLLSILEVIEEIEKISDQDIVYLTAMASNLSVDQLKKNLNKTNWKLNEIESDKVSGEYLSLVSPSGQSVVKIIYHHFGDILNKAELFIGLAGTANEQAVGLGKPVITFPGTGAQFNEKFARAQKALLGKAVRLVIGGNKEIASAVLCILNDPVIYQEMSKEGQERMGSSGGIKRMVELILFNLQEQPSKSVDNYED